MLQVLFYIDAGSLKKWLKQTMYNEVHYILPIVLWVLRHFSLVHSLKIIIDIGVVINNNFCILIF